MTRLIATILTVAAALTSALGAAVAADIEQWLGEHPLTGGSKYTEQQLELLKVRVGLRAREEGRLGDSLG